MSRTAQAAQNPAMRHVHGASDDEYPTPLLSPERGQCLMQNDFAREWSVPTRPTPGIPIIADLSGPGHDPLHGSAVGTR